MINRQAHVYLTSMQLCVAGITWQVPWSEFPPLAITDKLHVIKIGTDYVFFQLEMMKRKINLNGYAGIFPPSNINSQTTQ